MMSTGRGRARHTVIGGVSKVVVVDDQNRARRFWTGTMGFELVQDSPYGEGGERWLEVRTPGGAVVLVLGLRDRPDTGSEVPQALPTSPDPDGNRFALVPRGR